MTADEVLSSKVRAERKLWARIPQAKTLGKVFSLHKSKVETKSNPEHESNDAREDNATTERDRSANTDSSITLTPTTSIKHKSEREIPPDEQSDDGDAQSVATGISSVSRLSRRSTRRGKFRAVPISSRSMSHRTSSTSSSGLSGVRDDLSTAYSASTRMTYMYSTDEDEDDDDDDDDDDDLGLPFSAFDGTIEAFRVLMGDIDDNSHPSYSDSSSDSESECDSLNEGSVCGSESVASCKTSLHVAVPNASVVTDKSKNNDTIEVPNESKDHGTSQVTDDASVSVDSDESNNNGTNIHDNDDMSTLTAHVKQLVEIILEKKDTMPEGTSKQGKSVGGHQPSHPGLVPQEIYRSKKKEESDNKGYGRTEASSSKAIPSTERHEDANGTMMSHSFESTKSAVVSSRDIMDPAFTLNTDDVVEVSLVEFQTVQSEILGSKQASSQQISDDGDALMSSPRIADKGTGTSDPSRDNIGRYNWLKGLGSQLSRKTGARKSSTESKSPAQSDEVFDESQSKMIDQSPLEDEKEAKNNVDDPKVLENNQYPINLDEHRDHASISVGEQESPSVATTQKNNNTAPSVHQGEPSTGPKTKAKSRLFARLDKLSRKNAEGPKRSGTTKLELDNIPIIPTGSTHEIQDCSLADNQTITIADSGLSIKDVAKANTKVRNENKTQPVIVSTQGSKEAEEVEIDLELASLSKGHSTTFDSSSVPPNEVVNAISINDDQQPSIVTGKSLSTDADTDEKIKSGVGEYETRNDEDGERSIEQTTSTSSHAELREDHETHSTVKYVTEDAVEGDSSQPETCLSSMFCCFFAWEGKAPSICEHCQKSLMEGDESVEDDVGDPRCGMKAEFHSKCHKERVKLKEKKKKVIGQIRLFGHLKRKHLRRQRTLRKLRALEVAKKSNGTDDNDANSRPRQERKQVDEESRKQNHFMSRVLGRASNNSDGSPYKTRDEGRDDGGTTRRRRVPKTRESVSPHRRREQGQHAGAQGMKTSRSMSPMRRDRGYDGTNKPARRRLREGSPLRSYYQRGQVSPRNSSISRKKVQEAISNQRSRSLPRRVTPVRRQQSTSHSRKVRFTGVPHSSSASSSRTGGQSRHASPQQRKERNNHKKSKSVLSPGGNMVKRTMNSSRGSRTAGRDDDEAGYDINLEDYKVVKIKGIV